MYDYDKMSRLTQVSGKNYLIDYTFGLIYNQDGTVQKASGNGVQSAYTYDDHKRVTRITTTAGTHMRNMTTSFTYQGGMIQSDGPTTTGRISAITYSAAGNSDKLTFTYDANGNILTEKLNNAAYHSYVYDGLNQLVRENNVAAGKTWVYTYDNAGNILSKKEYAYTTATDLSSLTPLDTIIYTYGDSEWKDLLTAYDGQAITYDAIGNPTNYRGRQHYWSGRDLNTVVVASASAVQFAYNAAGQRISKSYAGSTTKFYYDDSGNLIGMRQNYDQPIKFQVNYATGEIDGFTQGTNTYWYRKNQQGDVTGIFNTAYGNTALFVEYEYDAWGNVISITGEGASTIGQTNPIRYRGYFYDTETGYYYLNSRYYDPTTGRFLNGDVYASTGQGTLGSNMFAYCLNNPVVMFDPTGTYAAYMTEQGRKAVQEEIAAKRKAKEGAEALKRSLDNNRRATGPVYEYKDPDLSSDYYTDANVNSMLKESKNYLYCTVYVVSRTLETGGEHFNTSGDAYLWYDNLVGGHKGKTVESRSVAVFEGGSWGHVVFVEFVDYKEGKIYYTEANVENLQNGVLRSKTFEEFQNLYGYTLVGYIYTIPRR